MALTITSPGVQITETDYSQTANIPTGTSVLVAGFAPQGPTDEIVTVTSLSEWQNIFGQPTNAAERYFYNTAAPLFNTQAIVNAYRLPYGGGLGTNFGSNYGALVYPVTAVDINYNNNGGNINNIPGPYGGSYGKGFTTLNAASANVMYIVGKPVHFELTESDYASIQGGNGINWQNTALPGSQINSVSQFGYGGIVVLNNAQTIVNNQFEGYYLGIADNSNIGPSTNFVDVLNVFTLSQSAFYTQNYVSVPQASLAFPLSSLSQNQSTSQVTSISNTIGNQGTSISYVLETSPSINVTTIAPDGTNYWNGAPQVAYTFNDTLIFGLFKLTQSSFNPTTTQLAYTLVESYAGSLDYWRQVNNPNGGAPLSLFVTNETKASPNIQVFVNPYISHATTQTWLDSYGNPSNMVRTVTQGYRNPMTLLQNLSAQYGITNPSTAPAQFNALSGSLLNLDTYLGEVDSIFTVGAYRNTSVATKDLGNIPAKLDRLFDIAENTELFNIDITVDGGISTIFANSTWFQTQPSLSSTRIYFDDSIVVNAVSGMYTNNFADMAPDGAAYAASWGVIFSKFSSFAGLARKDHLYIADLPRNIFVQGQNYLTLSNPNNNFALNVFNPIENIVSPYNTSYACNYGTWAKVYDDSIGNFMWAPFSGFAAAAMANTDTATAPWIAPAGFTRGNLTGTGITDLALYPKQKQRDQLYNISVNPVAFFPGEGFVIYGQKTMLTQPSAFDRINVRRLFLNLEKATAATVKYFVFEPNTVLTRTRVVNTLTPLFENAKNTEGLYDYLIVCDERNNTPNVIDQNELVVDIYLKPVRTAEFILVNFYATRTSQNFSELVGGTA